MEKCYVLKDKHRRQCLEIGLPCIFQAIGNILLQKVQAKHRPQSTKVRANGIGPIWSQICCLSQCCLQLCDLQPSFFRK